MTEAGELKRRLEKAQTDAELDAVEAWMVSEGWSEQMAREFIAITKLARAGEPLPDTPAWTYTA